MKKFVYLVPFLIVAAVCVYTSILFMKGEYLANWKHYVAIALVVVNGVLYCFNRRVAVLTTGLILFAATFDLVELYAETNTVAMRIFGRSTPDIEWKSLLVLLLWGGLNLDYFIEWRLDVREAKGRDRR
ncbi:hypothetical protein ACQ86N_26190 [Puia sp. P3]|uniref:hypothetical protein n=1 Tax=Puia sp. P3 TaxID=3423952 RepID=UPI003D67936A